MTNQSENERNDVLRLLLERPGLEAWARVCMSLLVLTAGIEGFMEDDDEHPHCDLRQRVQRALAMKEEAKLLDISGLHVFEYRVMSEETLELWQPLAESLEQFQGRHGANTRVWKAFSTRPSRATIEAWLMDRVTATGKC